MNKYREVKFRGRKYVVGLAPEGEYDRRAYGRKLRWYFYVEDAELERDVFQIVFPRLIFLPGHIYRR